MLPVLHQGGSAAVVGWKRNLNKLEYFGKTVAFDYEHPEIPYKGAMGVTGGISNSPWTLSSGFWSIKLLCGEGGWMCSKCAVKQGLEW